MAVLSKTAPVIGAQTEIVPGAAPVMVKAPAATVIPPATQAVQTATAAQRGPASTYQASTAGVALNSEDANRGTVEGRIAEIAGSGSKLDQLATTRANQTVNRRGLLNSSMAVGAAQDALYSAALPIAAADAANFNRIAEVNQNSQNRNSEFNATNTQAASAANTLAQNQVSSDNASLTQQTNLQNAQSQNSAFQNEFAAKNQAALQDANFAQDANKTYAGAMNDAAMAAYDAQFKADIANLDANSRAFIADLDASSRQLIQANSSVGGVFQNYVSQMAAIQQSPNMDAAGKTQALENLKVALKDSVAIFDEISGLNMTALLV